MHRKAKAQGLFLIKPPSHTHSSLPAAAPGTLLVAVGRRCPMPQYMGDKRHSHVRDQLLSPKTHLREVTGREKCGKSISVFKYM